MLAGTPKFKSREFKATLSDLKEIFDAHSLGITLMDALERRTAEQIYAKFARGQRGARLAAKKKTELVGQITAGFFSADEVAYQIIKELDRSCQKERHIVASIPEAQAPDRVGSYRAIALKRERAKLVWALARDQRASVRKLANRVITEFFQEAADVETARAVVDGDADASMQGVELAKRLKDQAQRLEEASEKLTAMESKVHDYEAERAKLLAQLGSKQRVLAQEEEAREAAETRVEELEKALAEAGGDDDELERLRTAEAEAKQSADELAQKVRRLAKLAGASEKVEEITAELDETKRRKHELDKRVEQLEAQLASEAEAASAARAKIEGTLEETREELRRARQQLADQERAPARPDREVPDGVMLLLDQANLAATATAVFRRKVNFSALYDRLAAGRPVRRAVAFVVDNGGTAFDAFCDTLKKSGWELRIKKPKTFADGSTKADWDMGIAMEAIERSDAAKTVVLVSGDGDFAPLVKQLKRLGARVEIAAFPEALALELQNVADAVTRLDASALE
ncbi:MAG: NYN domain-containing protein [Deltaproteobacteria bacterium]